MGVQQLSTNLYLTYCLVEELRLHDDFFVEDTNDPLDDLPLLSLSYNQLYYFPFATKITIKVFNI